MKRRLALLAGSLALCLGCLALVIYARQGNASGPPRPPREAEAAPRIAASKIAHVTVYPDSAW